MVVDRAMAPPSAPPSRVDRKQFLKWTLGSSAALALGCGPEPGTTRDTGGAGSGGTAAGAGGTPSTAGTGGSTVGGGGSGGISSGGISGGGAGGGGTAGSGGTAVEMPLPPDCNVNLRVKITADHGHVLNVTAADVIAGVDKLYDTTGTSMHPHWIQLTAADFAELQAGGTVRKLSCNDGHEHEFIINCTGISNPSPTAGGVIPFCDPDHLCGESTTNVCPDVP